MRGTVAKRLRRRAAELSIGRRNRWGIVRIVKRFREPKTGEVSSVNRDTRVYDPLSGRAIYRQLKKAWRAGAA